ncbi:MAG: SRPBCC domain-containing protein, partial [Pseudomonadota bacterium]
MNHLRMNASQSPASILLIGEKIFDAPQVDVYDALHDVSVLAEVIPGCEGFVRHDDGSGRALIVITIGPVDCRFELSTRLIGDSRPQGFAVSGVADAGSVLGSVTGEAHVILSPIDASTTSLSYEVAAAPAGRLAEFSKARLESTASSLLEECFARLELLIEPRGEKGPAVLPAAVPMPQLIATHTFVPREDVSPLLEGSDETQREPAATARQWPEFGTRTLAEPMTSIDDGADEQPSPAGAHTAEPQNVANADEVP